MQQPDITKDYAAALKDFPDQTQLAISLYKKGKTDYFGLRKDQAGIHPSDTADFVFEIGSVTKAFTGNVLAQLILEEKVRPDDAILTCILPKKISPTIFRPSSGWTARRVKNFSIPTSG